MMTLGKRFRRTIVLLNASLLSALACTHDSPTGVPRPRLADSPRVSQAVGDAPLVFVGAGDIGNCSSTGDELTANLLDGIAGTVFTTGDNINSSASALVDYQSCYAASWGRHQQRTRPAAGDKDVTTATGGGYFTYFGGAAVVGDSTKYYYSYELGSWHVVVLNSNISMSAGSAQETWLKADLAAHPTACTVAIWHHPRFYTSGTSSSSLPIWNVLYGNGVELVLNGHRHNYERFAPQKPDGSADPDYGIRQIIVGTGGYSHGSFGSTPAANSEVRDKTSYGVLILELDAASYTWRFMPVAGATFNDSGTGTCHGNPPPVAKPGGPYSSESSVKFDGSASSDPRGDTPLTYAWDFGDGTTGTGATPTHVYTTFQSFPVTLIVTNSKGVQSAPATTTANIANVPPKVTLQGTSWVLPGTSYALSVTITDPGNDFPYGYVIDWGDNATTSGEASGATASISARHDFAEGTYTVKVSVTDKNGGSTTATQSVAVRTPSQSARALLIAGDIASCSSTGDEATATLLDGLTGTVVALGDNVIASGKYTDYTSCYEPSWGRHKARTKPVAGDKDYAVSGAGGYYTYFGAAAGDTAKYYYSFDVDSWHVIVLNTSISTSAGSAQEQWLKADLAANTRDCIVALWHYPMFYTSGSRSAVKPLWDDLYAAGAELVVNAHTRNYERFAPQRPDGSADPAYGIRELIVGTGGYSHGSFGSTPAANSEVRDKTAYGVLELTLDAGSYYWRFRPTVTTGFTDMGMGSCHPTPNPVARPGGPYRSESVVQLDGSASIDPRNELPLTYAWTFGDGTTGTGVAPSHTYTANGTYTVTLTIKNAKGVSSAPTSTTATIGNIAPVVNAGADVTTPDVVDLSATFSDPGAADAPWNWDIDWGDGVVDRGSTSNQSAAIAARHIYAANGTYHVLVSVTDKDGGKGTDELIATVQVPVASVVVQPASANVDVGATAQFTAAAFGPNGQPLPGRTVTWSTSDGSKATVDGSGIATASSAGTVSITASIEGKTGNANLAVFGLPFGPFHLPDNLFAAPFTGLLRGTNSPENLLATLQEARKQHFRVVIRLARGSVRYSNPDSTFNLELWRKEIDPYRTVDLTPYIEDGTIIGHFLFDEPRDPTNWGGVPVPYETIEAAAQYSKSIWPTLPVGVGSPASQLVGGGPFQYLDFALLQYRVKKGEITAWLNGELAAAQQAHLGVQLSLNVLAGRLDNTPLSPDEIKQFGSVLVAEPRACIVTMWKYDDEDPRYFQDQLNLDAMAVVAAQAAKRSGAKCRP